MTATATDARRWPVLATAIGLAAASLLPAVIFALAFDTSCAGQDTVAPPSPESLRGRLCEQGVWVEITMLVAPAGALLLGGIAGAWRRAWVPLLAGGAIAVVVLAVSLAVAI